MPEWLGLDRLAPPRLIELPEGTRLLVLAPHPDDESIGCGGLIAKWMVAGRRAKIVIITDGAMGGEEKGASEADTSLARAGLVEQRSAEAMAAAAALGGAELAFLGCADGHLADAWETAVQDLADHIEQFHPDVLTLPYTIDRHPDHVAATPLMLGALARVNKSRRPAIVLGYEVWSPLTANILISIDPVVDRKARAIEAHASQTAQRDYVAAALALNTYRGISGLANVRYAEAYWMGTPEDWQALWSRVRV